MNAMGNTIRRCEKCNKVVRSKSGFYISIYSRKTYKNRRTRFYFAVNVMRSWKGGSRENDEHSTDNKRF